MLLYDKFQNNLKDTKVGVFGMCYSNKHFFHIYFTQGNGLPAVTF